MINEKTIVLPERKSAIMDLTENRLILHNDDHNSFEYVEDCLIQVCKHTSEQAQQCALLVHYTGKCSVMHGSVKDLIHAADKLKSADLTVEIV